MIEEHDAHRRALLSGTRTVTYGELRSEVAAARAHLARAGLADGDRVALISGNSVGFVIAYLAVLGRGLIAVPLNPQYSETELRAQLDAVGARAVIGSAEARPFLESVAVLPTSGLEVIFGLDTAALVNPPEGDAAEGGNSAGTSMVSAGLLGADSATSDETAEVSEIVDCHADDIAVLMFTSGTAGSPKAAMLSHANLGVNIRQVMSHPGLSFQDDEVVLGVLPVFHIMGLNSMLGVSMARGVTLALVRDFDPSAVVGMVAEHGVSVISGPPTMWAALAAVPDVGPDDTATVGVAVSGAAPLPVAVADSVQRKFGMRLTQGYGLTEASPAVTTSAGVDAPVSSIGVPLPGIELRLVDSAGADALVGDEGELWVRGPNVFQGYWEEEDATIRALPGDGWLRTGDIAVVDDEGFLYLVDRAKDLIIVSGFNVFPAEVEAVLARHPGVESAAVVGVADSQTGEAVEAYVVLVTGADLDEEGIRAWSSEHLARYKWPRKVTIVSELPRGLGGKLLRRALG